jgi:5-deoxy-glucuronate isomerase
MTSRLHIRPEPVAGEPQVLTRVLARRAGWKHLNFEVRRLREGESWSHDTDGSEAVIVLLGGRGSAAVEARGESFLWQGIGERATVFDGLPTTLYLPPGARLELRAESTLELAHAWTRSRRLHAPRLVTPGQCTIEIRGGGNATRQIVGMVPPEFEADRLMALEVLTPGGNSSSYPPHKHDQHVVGHDGRLLEADLEEIYYYRIDSTVGDGGYAVQRVYTDDRRLDEVVVAQDGDVVLVPEGYHPVAAAHGYDCYYLNFLAGSARSLACRDDPAHAWVRSTWSAQDERAAVARLAGARA